MKVDIGWLFTAILFGVLLGGRFTDFIPVLSLVIVIAHTVYTFYIIFRETYL